MNSLIKFGVAGALALGGTVAAHAGIAVPTSSGTTGDVVLYADVFTGTTLDGAYVGDTNISVDSVGGGTKPATFTDANLNTLLGEATAGTTLVWAIEGGSAHSGPAPYMVSSGTLAALAPTSGSQLTQMFNNFNSNISNINAQSGIGANSSILLTDAGTTELGGTGFNPTVAAPDAHTWYGGTGNVTTTGLNTQTALYLMSAASTSAPTGAVTALFNAALTSSGLVFSDIGGGGSVPIPAAVWLLGSGLLGLAGVARRKKGGIASAA